MGIRLRAFFPCMAAAVLLLAIVGCDRSSSRDVETVVGDVARVVDGDTVWVKVDGDSLLKVRMNRIDAPESDQPFGDVSTAALAGLVSNRIVKVQCTGRDKYGRTLGIVFLGELDVNLEMVRRGFAWHYKYFDDTPEYAEAERIARGARLGLWQTGMPVNPYDWRHRVVNVSSTVGRNFKCPRCGSAMDIRMSIKLGREFYVCTRHPDCPGNRPYMDDDDPWVCSGCNSTNCPGCTPNEHWVARSSREQ